MPATRRLLSLALSTALLLAPARTDAIVVGLTNQDVERALKLGRSAERERAPFHARYVVPVPSSVVQQLEIITEFRRYVLKTEERSRLGDFMFSQGVRAAREMMRGSEGRVSVIAQIQFDPLNTFVSVPPYVVLVGGTPQVAPLEGHTTPITSLASPSSKKQTTYLVGATIQLDFDAAALGQSARPVSIVLDGKELTRVTIDFGALE